MAPLFEYRVALETSIAIEATVTALRALYMCNNGNQIQLEFVLANAIGPIAR